MNLLATGLLLFPALCLSTDELIIGVSVTRPLNFYRGPRRRPNEDTLPFRQFFIVECDVSRTIICLYELFFKVLRFVLFIQICFVIVVMVQVENIGKYTYEYLKSIFFF